MLLCKRAVVHVSPNASLAVAKSTIRTPIAVHLKGESLMQRLIPQLRSRLDDLVGFHSSRFALAFVHCTGRSGCRIDPVINHLPSRQSLLLAQSSAIFLANGRHIARHFIYLTLPAICLTSRLGRRREQATALCAGLRPFAGRGRRRRR